MAQASRASKNLIYGKSGYAKGKKPAGIKTPTKKGMHKMKGGHMMKNSEM